MNILSKIFLLVVVLGLSACGGNQFGAGAGGGGGAGAGAGAESNPNSVAYFNETVGDRVLFEVDQSTLTAEARAVLDAQADWMLRNMEFRAVIEGHADEQGTRDYNLALGARRAASVRDYLINRGVSDSRLTTVSYGKERPLAICSEESCYRQNRRAVTVLSAGAGA
ncbi:peptidoglycan-associated lipoprotein Pal [Rhodobacteraceae bacterium W635]|uniref:peptidoglycan-associated lipoprotein Pal n=1 Tax=Nioella halotolerans TaxID=2303578 RepID=UPI000E3D0883|nr:peptidoglycan-associated lipoprotein Pal [Rhodobacteraceae bacterium W635]